MAERRIETSIEIDVAPARVWAILTDFAAMPSWNPFIKAISGNLVKGGQLSVQIAPPGKSAMRFKPTVLSVRPERELRWLGHVLFPGLFDGEHYFQLEPIDDGRTRFTQGEKFSGILCRASGRHIICDLGRLRGDEQGSKAAGRPDWQRLSSTFREPAPWLPIAGSRQPASCAMRHLRGCERMNRNQPCD